jgi:hypothetical protein
MSPESPAEAEGPAKSSFEVEAELAMTSRAVTIQDVIDYGLRFHAKCSGKGWTGTKDDPHLCPCAVKRFMRANAGKLYQTGPYQYAWLKGQEPAEEPA